MANFFKTGEISGSTTAKQLPSIPFGFQAWIKAQKDNTGVVCLGTSTVTLADGTTDVTTGLELSAKEMIILQGPGNLNSYYIICTAATDDVIYMVEG